MILVITAVSIGIAAWFLIRIGKKRVYKKRAKINRQKMRRFIEKGNYEEVL